MAKLHTALAAFLVSSALGGEALAQTAAPITNRDVIGEWSLTITPAEREDLDISITSADGGQPEFPMTITAPAGGRLSCVVRDSPAECRIRDGALVVVVGTRSGGARLTFTLTDRTRGGFTGTAGMRVRFLPIGGHLGSVTMARRQGPLPRA